MTILPPCLMYKHNNSGKIVILKNDKQFFKRTIEESLLSITKDYTKKKIKSNTNQLRLYFNNSLKYVNKLKYINYNLLCN